MLKPSEEIARNLLINAAAFGRLCVETSLLMAEAVIIPVQPPSGGCVLKPKFLIFYLQWMLAAAFGRLCVETLNSLVSELATSEQPPSGGCVLKHHVFDRNVHRLTAATFRWLCVETKLNKFE